MKFLDSAYIALTGLWRRWMLIPVIGLILATVSLTFAGTAFASVREEKAEPCELTAVPSEGKQITDQTALDVQAIPNVISYTPVAEIPATLTIGKYSASLTLYGIDRNYLQDGFASGGLFPQDTVMPYIVLNNAAMKRFVDPSRPPDPEKTDDMPQIDWLNANVNLSMGGGDKLSPSSAGSVTSKICGTLAVKEEEEEQPAGYIDLNVAQELMKKNGLPNALSAWVRIGNVGFAQDITGQLANLGLNAANPGEANQDKWDDRQQEAAYLIVAGFILLVSSVFCMAVIGRSNLLEMRQELNMLLWMGMSRRALRRLLFLQTTFLGALGALLGVLAGYLVPSFVPAEVQAASIFALPVPAMAAGLAGLFCFLLFLIAGIYDLKKIR